jgi:hypothetical protein
MHPPRYKMVIAQRNPVALTNLAGGFARIGPNRWRARYAGDILCQCAREEIRSFKGGCVRRECVGYGGWKWVGEGFKMRWRQWWGIRFCKVRGVLGRRVRETLKGAWKGAEDLGGDELF